MSETKYHRMPARDPVTGGELYVSELTSEDSGITIRGKFEVPRYAKLDAEQQHFLETFLRCRGMLNAVERELGLSYPTVRLRLDGVLEALGFAPTRDEPQPKRERISSERKRKILEELESGQITPEEAKAKLGVAK